MRKVNYFMWIFVLLFLVSAFFYLLISQDIILYLAPRMIPMLCFGSVVLLILLINKMIGIKNIAQNHKSKFNIKYLLFFVPIVLFLTAKPDESMVSGMSNQNVTIPYLSGVVSSSANNGNKVYGTRKAPTEVGGAAVADLKKTNEEVDETTNTGALDINPCILTMNDSSTFFQDDFKELFSDDVLDMVGQEASIYGFVFNYEVLGENTIIVARKIVSCCIADAYIVGYPVRVENASDFETNEWVEVSGIISQTETSNESGTFPYPVIVGGAIRKIEIPSVDKMYVYP